MKNKKRSIRISVLVVAFHICLAIYSQGGVDYHLTLKSYGCTTTGKYESLTLPAYKGEIIDTIRGLILYCPVQGSATNFSYPTEAWSRWLYDHKFGFVIMPNGDDTVTFKKAMQFWIDSLKRPELNNVPFCITSHSSGSMKAIPLANWYNSRTICGYFPSLSNSSHNLTVEYFPWGINRLKDVPMMYLFPALSKDFIGRIVYHNYLKGASKGYPWSIMISWDANYPGCLQLNTGFTQEYFDEMIRLRYPQNANPKAGPVTLKVLKREDGWMGELIHMPIKTNMDVSQVFNQGTPNFCKDFGTYFPYIAPYNDFERYPKTNHCWLPSKRIAYIWRSIVSMSYTDVRLESEDFALSKKVLHHHAYQHPEYSLPGYIFNDKQTIKVRVANLGFTQALKAEFFANEQKLGEDLSAPFEFTYALDNPGIYSLYAVLTSACGDKRITATWADASTVTIVSSTLNGNQSPTCTQVANFTSSINTTTNIPFTIGDAEKPVDSLKVYFKKMEGGLTGTHTGTGSTRNLAIKTPAAPGIYGAILQVSDGSSSINEYIQVVCTSGVNQPPTLMNLRSYNKDYIAQGVWTLPMAIYVEDVESHVDSLKLTGKINDPTYILPQNLMISGTGTYRTIQFRMEKGKVNNANAMDLYLSDGNLKDTLAALDISCITPISNTPPLIYAPTLIEGDMNTPTELNILNIYDFHDRFEDLVVSVKNISDTNLFAAKDVYISTCGLNNAVISVNPKTDRFGEANLVLEVKDKNNSTALDTIKIKINGTSITGPAFTSFSIDTVTFSNIIDLKAHTVKIELIEGVDLTSLKTIFSVPAGYTAKVNSIAQTSGVNSNDFSVPVIYEISDGTLTQLWNVTIKSPKKKNNETEILDFKIRTIGNSEYIGTTTINNTSKTININLPTGTSITKYIADYTLSDGASAFITSIIQVDNTTENIFKLSVVYTIVAEDGINRQDWTLVFTYEPAALTNHSEKLTVYPCPAKDEITISSDKTLTSLIITDELGRICQLHSNIDSGETIIDISELVAGIYTIKALTVDGYERSLKIIKQ